MPQSPYEFANRFEKLGLSGETFSLIPKTKQQQERMEKITAGVKKFIQECQVAHSTSKKPTIRFIQNKLSHTR